MSHAATVAEERRVHAMTYVQIILAVALLVSAFLSLSGLITAVDIQLVVSFLAGVVMGGLSNFIFKRRRHQ